MGLTIDISVDRMEKYEKGRSTEVCVGSGTSHTLVSVY